MKTNRQFRLAWKFDVYAHIPLSRNLIYVDAITGDILDVESKIYYINSPGTATTRFSGTRNIVADSFTGGFRLRELRNNVRIETYNMRNHGTNYSGANDFVDSNNNWTSAEFNNANMDNAALDAHWGTEMVYDYFSTVHSRNSWNGAGGPLLNYVHTNLVAFGLPNNVNAFWDGRRMTYGDGDACHDPLTSLDVVAHEIAHGINTTSARMRYRGESGALNESLSDIWAACVEMWAATEKQTWLLGEDITLCNDAFRSMSNPNAHGQPDTYQTHPDEEVPFWHDTSDCSVDNCGVHTNSGVPNYWFFLLVNGGTGTNDIDNCYDVMGIGINRVARIVYRAETVILASVNEQSVTFNQFKNATITSASNLYGADSPEVISVTNAWHAVGVGNQYQYSITGPTTVCSTGATFTINNLSASVSSIIWTHGPNLSISSGQNSANCTFLATGNGASWVRATLVPDCGEEIVLPQQMVWAGVPDHPRFNKTSPFYVPINSNHTISVESSGADPIFSTNWTASACVTLVSASGNYGSFLSCPVDGCGTIYVSTSNHCGTSNNSALFIVSGNGGDCESPESTVPIVLIVSPNPSSGETTLTIEHGSKDKSFDKTTIWTLEVYTQNQRLIVKNENLKGNTYTLNTSRWEKGVYIVTATINNVTFSEKLIVR